MKIRTLAQVAFAGGCGAMLLSCATPVSPPQMMEYGALIHYEKGQPLRFPNAIRFDDKNGQRNHFNDLTVLCVESRCEMENGDCVSQYREFKISGGWSSYSFRWRNGCLIAPYSFMVDGCKYVIELEPSSVLGVQKYASDNFLVLWKADDYQARQNAMLQKFTNEATSAQQPDAATKP